MRKICVFSYSSLSCNFSFNLCPSNHLGNFSSNSTGVRSVGSQFKGREQECSVCRTAWKPLRNALFACQPLLVDGKTVRRAPGALHVGLLPLPIPILDLGLPPSPGGIRSHFFGLFFPLSGSLPVPKVCFLGVIFLTPSHFGDSPPPFISWIILAAACLACLLPLCWAQRKEEKASNGGEEKNIISHHF